jgi:hypothetical protein
MRTFAKIMLVLGIITLVLAVLIADGARSNSRSSGSKVWLSCPTFRGLEDYPGQSYFKEGSSSICVYVYTTTPDRIDAAVDAVPSFARQSRSRPDARMIRAS